MADGLAARDARNLSTLSDETTHRRFPNCLPSSLPASIHRKTVWRDLPRICAASRAGISETLGSVAGGVSQAVRMARRWAWDMPPSVSRMAATAARTAGEMREMFGAVGLLVGFMLPFLLRKKSDCKRKQATIHKWKLCNIRRIMRRCTEKQRKSPMICHFSREGGGAALRRGGGDRGDVVAKGRGRG